MRAKQSRMLRKESRRHHLRLITEEEIPMPQTPAEAEYQLRRLYKSLKKAWKTLSEAEKDAFGKHLNEPNKNSESGEESSPTSAETSKE